MSKRMIASAFKGLLVVSIPENLLKGAKAGSAHGHAVLHLPERGWYEFWVTHNGPDVTQHMTGPDPDPPDGFTEDSRYWEPYRVARIFGMSSKQIRID